MNTNDFDSTSLLSELIVYMKYARYIKDDLSEKETWDQLIERNKRMNIEKFPQLSEEIEHAYQYVLSKKILPSMRALQFSGLAINVNPVRGYNCAFTVIDDIKAFPEIMFLLLSGCGVGFSVQKHHVNNLPCIKRPTTTRNKRFLIADSIEGWSDAVKALIKSYFCGGKSNIVFDYRAIRPQGSLLKTSGGIAPGHYGLQTTLNKIRNILENKKDGEQLSTIECHDIVCHIANCVLSGGIRRSALISLFSEDDVEMFSSKTGEFYLSNPQRCFANNSVVIERDKIDDQQFRLLWEKIFSINTGEPGIYLTNDKNLGTNPCCEISLNPFQFCNLVEINTSTIENSTDYFERCRAAAFIATLQASYTDFHYLRSIWKKNTERESLIGVSMTGLASNLITSDMMEEGARIVKSENQRVASLVGINSSARCTTVKPAGTSSIVLGCSSGIHAWYDYYYLRRVRIMKSDPLYIKLVQIIPELIEDDFIRSHDTAVISIPITCTNKNKVIVRQKETSLQFLERVKTAYKHWIIKGHTKGKNMNNVSATVNVRVEEREEVVRWLYENRFYYNGITVFQPEDSVYKQMPFESISEELYHSYNNYVRIKKRELYTLFHKKVVSSSEECDYMSNYNVNDYTLNLESACSGNVCELI